MKKFLILLLIPFCVYSQDSQSQSIELPDFVITGVQDVDIPVRQKEKPALVTTLSKEFFNPDYKPDEFKISEFSDPIRIKNEEDVYGEHYDGLLNIGAGVHTLPVGEFYFNRSFQHVLFRSKVWGANIGDYVPYADYNESGLSIGTDFYVNSTAKFQPGLRVSFDGGFVRNKYQFYGSSDPSRERETQKAIGSISFINTLGRYFKYGLNFEGNFVEFKNNGLKEDLLKGSGFFEFHFNRFGLGFNGEYVGQSLKNNLTQNDSYTYYQGNGYIDLKPNNTFNIKAGVHYSEQDTNSHFALLASMTFKIDKNVTMMAEYWPDTEFKTVHDMLAQNQFYMPGLIDNIFLENKDKFKVAFKYEYSKYFEVSFGFSSTTSNNYLYFDDPNNDGFFAANTAADVSKSKVFVNTFFHLGPYGRFYGSAAYQTVEFLNDNSVPYEPEIITELTYGYDFPSGFTFQITSVGMLNSYTDAANTNELEDYVNLSVMLGYRVNNNLELYLRLENVLDKENYMFHRYEEKPFDIIGGIKYNW